MAIERLSIDRLVSGNLQEGEEINPALSLRPEHFAQYIGQPTLIRKLKIAVEAARRRKETVEHILLHGPPGLGKTTLAHVVANEMGSKVHVTNGPALTRGADLSGILNSLEPRDVLFIDEIHRLPVVVEECLYSAMEDFKIDLTNEAGLHARTFTIEIKPFTLIGATTRIGLLTGAMRSRFGLVEHLDFYSPKELQEILRQNVKLLKVEAETEALSELSRRSRGTPRVANRLLRRVRDYAVVEANGKITLEVTRKALDLEGINELGLDEQDRTLLRTLIDVYGGGPAGIDAIAATMGEERDTLEDVIEPYLLQTAMITRTRQGRRATKSAYEHLGLKWTPPKIVLEDETLFERPENGEKDDKEEDRKLRGTR